MLFKKIFRVFQQHTTPVSPTINLLSKRIGYSITQPHIFCEALRHRSSLQLLTPSQMTHSNERLEFLGDSILNFIVAEYVYQQHPDWEEGKLTKLRACLVNKKALTVLAKQIRLNELIEVNPSLPITSKKGNETIIADGFEAIIAAIYLDGGYDCAKKFVLSQLHTALSQGTLETTDENFKSQLLELSQGKNWGIPTYNVITEEGPNHNRTFGVEVTINNTVQGNGIGKSKKDAEQNAAEDALKKIL
ncbi:MAG: ribonuclease III [Ignavibacteria bacterium]|nr:ribonuclease III [Ignavibacteria bacterium]